MAQDWLADFVQHTTFGEASPRLMWWVGVSTIAGVLRRKVWIDERDFQWTPNFYILIVGEPGAVRKSTSMDLGLRLLKKVAGINLGPGIVTWQALIQYVAEQRESLVLPDGEIFDMSCVTLGLSEFGSFFDPENRELVDNLTDLWDSKLGSVTKMTKTSGNDTIINPWINILAATTPAWLAQNFTASLVGGGLASRFIFLRERRSKRRIAYPSRQMPPRAAMADAQAQLVNGLEVMAKYAGEYHLTEDAYAWGEAWYNELQDQLDTLDALGNGNLEAGFLVRKQGHLHKLAMVISASRFEFPTVTREHLEEAAQQLAALEGDTGNVFGYVGQSKVTQAAREIVEAVKKGGAIEKRLLYQRQFFRTMSIGEFNEAVQSAIHAELIYEQDGVAKPTLIPR